MSYYPYHTDPYGFLSNDQSALVNAYLDPHGLKLDDRKLSELMAYVAKISDQFSYYDLNDKRQGDWSDFFKTDLTALLATISQKNRQEEYDKVLDFLNGIPFTENDLNNSDFLWEIFSRAFETILEVNEWYYTVSQYYINHSFQVYLYQAIWQKLSFNFKKIYYLYFEAISKEIINDKEKIDNMFKRFQQLQSIWNFEPFPVINKRPNSQDLLKNSSYRNELSGAIKDLYNIYASVIHKAEKEFYKTLKTGKVSPHIALLASFLKTYGHQQKALNKMVPKHLKFYYEDMLDFHKNGASADSVYLLMTLNKTVESFSLNANTQLDAGVDTEGDALVFKTEDDLLVVPSVISDYWTMFSTKFTDPTSEDRNFMTSSVTGFSKPVIDKSTGKYQGFSMFGLPAKNDTNILPKATLGFAVASPELWMEGGDRQLVITFDLTNNDKAPEQKHSKKKSKEGSEATNISSILNVTITGQKKWLAPACFSAMLSDSSLVLTLGFDEGVTAIGAYNAKTHGAGYETNWPILKATLVDEANYKNCENLEDNTAFTDNPYKTLSKVNFSSFTIASTVNKLGVLTVKAGSKTVPATSELTPFGSIPAVGSRLMVGSYEAFIKQTQEMCLSVNWVSLPSEDGFKAYYAAYNQYLKEYPSNPKFSFARDAYKCEFDLLEQGTWEPGNTSVELFGTSTCKSDHQIEFEEAEEKSKHKGLANWKIVLWIKKHLPLFKKESAEKPKELTNINYDVGVKGGIIPDYSLTSPLKYSDKSKSGFLSLTLSEPELAFGNEIYPKVVNEVTLKNTMKAAKKFTIGTALKKILAASTLLVLAAVYTGIQTDELHLPKKKKELFNKKLVIDRKALTIAKDNVTLKKDAIELFSLKLPSSAKSVPTHTAILVIIGLYALNQLLFRKQKKFSEVPNKPYVPKIKGLSVSYYAERKVVPGEDNNHQFYMIHPFGIEETTDDKSSWDLIPQYDEWGYVFLSLSELYADSTLTLFLGVEDRTDTKISDDFQSVGVEYLSTSSWQEAKILSDSTYGLNKNGIISIQIGSDPDNANGTMPTGSYWLRLSGNYKQMTETQLTVLATNAVSASRIMTPANEWEQLEQIPAGTIKSFIQPVQAISKVVQPFNSFGGEEPETTAEFHQRVSQRIGHKERGGSVESIQAIILDKFREVYQVNVVPGKYLRDPKIPNDQIQVTVVPWISDSSAKDSFKPVSPASVLAEIDQELNGKVNDQLDFVIEHAGYEELEVSLDVYFVQPDQNIALKEQLNTDLILFLSPWIKGNQLAYQKKTVHANDIIHFINSRAYVNRFEELRISLGKVEVYNSNLLSDSMQLLRVGDPRNILISATEHNITPKTESTTTENISSPIPEGELV